MNTEMLENLNRQSDLVYHLAAVVGVEHYVRSVEVLNVKLTDPERAETRAPL